MSGSRLPALQREHVANPDQKAAFDALEKEAAATFGPPGQSPFVYKNSSGAFVGPFPFFLAAPDAGTHFLGLFRKLSQIPGLPPDVKETVILAVGAHFQASYEMYAHSAIAIDKVGMSAEAVEVIKKGEKPGSLSEECSLAYDTSMWLLEKPGKLRDELWERCVKAFGKEGAVALVHYVGGYAYTCIVLNAMDAPVPE